MNPITKVRQMLSSSRLARRPSGQMLAILAVALVALLGAVALCADIGVFYYNWAQLQKCVDNAALAGANYLPDNPANLAIKTAKNYVTTNGRAGDALQSGTPTIIPNYPVGATTVSAIRVQVKRPAVSYLFARLLGATSGSIIAEATAGAMNIRSANGFIPLGFSCTGALGTSGCPGTACAVNSTSCPTYQLHLPVLPSGFGELAITGQGGATYSTLLNTGYSGSAYQVGQVVSVNTNPGTKFGPTLSGITARLSRSFNTSISPDVPVNWSYVPDDSRVVLIPLVNFSGSAGMSPGTVIGYETGWIEGISGVGNNQKVDFQVIDATAGSGTGSTTAPNTGGFVATLLK